MTLSSALVMAAISETSSPSLFDLREQDWRNGSIVYQVFVDRFNASTPASRRANLYPAPRTLKQWSDPVLPGQNDPQAGVWSHELQFWGGDLKGIEQKLDYIESLGAGVLYMTPIFAGLTNHKYDGADYFAIAPEFGTMADFASLRDRTHKKGMKVMLDGVFNHFGRVSPLFQAALKDAKDPKRDWFHFGSEYPNGYRGWVGVANLPAWNLENSAVRSYLWKGRDSVVNHWLKQGIDGWRLDVAFELGPDHLKELTAAAHAAKKGSAVVGEISGYPESWEEAVDGVFNFMAPNIVVEAVKGNISGHKASRLLERMMEDTSLDHLLKSWLHLDNHDTPRIASILPDAQDRALAWTALFTLPGSPVIYYGSELGVPGSGDPANRAPMPWDKVTDKNPDLSWVKKLTHFRTRHRALRVGDFTPLETDRLIAYSRTTDRVRDSVIVVINPTSHEVTETFTTRMGRILSWGEFEDVLSGDKVRSVTGLFRTTLAPKSVQLYVPITDPARGALMYYRIP